MSKAVIEHWRDGERIERLVVTETHLQRVGDVTRIVFPPGMFILATDDELRFRAREVIEVLEHAVR